MSIKSILKAKFQAFHNRFKVCFFMRMVCAILFGIISGMIAEAIVPYPQAPKQFIAMIAVMVLIYISVADYFERH